MTDLEAQIHEVLKKDHTSFAQLNRIEGFGNGHFALCKGHENLVLWPHMSREAIEIIEWLLDEDVVHLHVTTKLTYLIDGCVPALPLATSRWQYKTPHWIPAVLKNGSAEVCTDRDCPGAVKPRARP
jgi:hypothetical protein